MKYLLWFCLGLTACGGGSENVEQKAKTQAKVVKPKTKAQMAEEESFSYSSVGKRDPFRSYIEVLKEIGNQDTGRKLEETEKYELDQYKLTGLLTGSSQPLVLVEDPEGKGHVLRIGSRLGKNGGRVSRITSSEMIVMEEYRDPKGKLVQLPITIKLPQADIGTDNVQ